MKLEVIAGTISTIIFTLSNIPMLLKVARTHSLHSYSYAYIVMNNTANLIHWFYILAMPPGPVWFLHGFYTISSMIMLFWYLRYEKKVIKNFFLNKRRVSSLLRSTFYLGFPK